VRSGAERADVTPEFAIRFAAAESGLLHEHALEGDPKPVAVASAVVDANGRSRAFINATPRR